MASTLASACVALLAGCTNLAPSYERPAAPVAGQWPAATTPAASTPSGNATTPDPLETPLAADTGWRTVLADARLQRVVELALAQSRTQRIASLDIDRARALYRIERAARLPTVSAGVGVSRQRTPATTSASGRASISETWSADLGLASYEIDFFGRVHNLGEAALQRYLAAEQTQRSAQISLVAEVAQAWLTLAADQERLALARRTLEANQSSFELSRQRHALGADSGLVLAQARTAVDSARVALADVRRQVAQDRSALTLLVGAEVPEADLPGASLPPLSPTSSASPPAAGVPAPVAAAGTPPRLVAVPADLPSTVLQRRPDVLAAERELEAAHADIGVARAALFPSISLTAALGNASRALDDLFEARSRTWSLSSGLAATVFDGGALRANVQVAEIDRQLALARYEQALQTAFSEVADTLALRAELGEQLDAQRSLVDATDRSLGLAQARYRSGADSYLEVLDAQRSLYTAQQTLIGLQLSEQASRVTLYRVLGGGWTP